jgi:soluble lytic murein transglycosylase-like protein
MLAKELHVDLYVVAEHAMQLGLMDISAAAKDPEELEMLRVHLNREHVIEHLVESVSVYDAEAAEYIREGQSLLHQKERALRDLVELWTRYNLDPKLIREIILQELQRRTAEMRSKLARKH